MYTVDKLESANPEGLIYVTLSGIVIEFNEPHPANTLAPKLVTLSGIVKVCNLE